MVKLNKLCVVPFGIVFASVLGVASAQADEVQFNYNLAPGASTGSYGIPASNTPVQLTGVQTASGFRGVGQATVLRVSPTAFLEWVGIDISSNESSTTPVVSSGFSSAAGQHIIWLDFDKLVDVEVASATQIKVHNASTVRAKGTITLVW